MSGGRRGSDRILFVALIVLLAWLPLPWGSKPPSAAAMIGVAAGLLILWRLLLEVRGLPYPDLPRTARLAFVVWSLWLGWQAVHLVPLPPGLLRWISPHSYEAHAAILALGARPLYTLTIEPSATINALLLGATYFGVFWLVLVSVARNRERQRLLLTAIFISGVAQASYGVVMTLSGWEYGFLEQKTHGQGVATGTFVNRNHFAGYLQLSVSAGVALVLADLRAERSRTWHQRLSALIELALSPKVRTRVMLAVLVIALVLTRSRLGNVALFAALGVSGAMFLFVRHRRYFLRGLVFFVSLFAVDLLIISEHYGLQKLAERLENTTIQSEQRALLFADLEPVLTKYAVTGSGPGTFAAAYAPYRSPDVLGFFDHAHNDHLQFVIETGLIGYALVVLLAGVALVHGLRLMAFRADPMACAAGFAVVMALTAMAIHGLGDFNLQIPANAATLVALMALALSFSQIPRHARRTQTA